MSYNGNEFMNSNVCIKYCTCKEVFCVHSLSQNAFPIVCLHLFSLSQFHTDNGVIQNMKYVHEQDREPGNRDLHKQDLEFDMQSC